MKKVELLAPAGDLEKLKIAILYGANAVFLGGLKFSLRSRASNFTIEDIKEGCNFAHLHNAKIHVTCNILPHEIDIEGIYEYLHNLEEAGVDAIITSSPSIIKTVIEKTHMECHISTQESTLNSKMVDLWKSIGAKRVVLGRELSIEEIKEIKSKTDLEIETFIHGGMCVSYSGRCMLSNNMTNRDANRGGCAHSCRWAYDLYMDGKKINQEDPFSMSSKDLCSIRFIKELIETNVDSFKIEGRMKSLHYIATIVKAYRQIIDEYYNTGTIKDYSIYESRIRRAENRETSIGFLKGMTKKSEQLYNLYKEEPTQEFVGIVEEYDDKSHIAKIDVRNYFDLNDTLEIFSPNKEDLFFKIDEIKDENGLYLDAARHPRTYVYIKSKYHLDKYDMLRAKRK
jgi:putative protease